VSVKEFNFDFSATPKKPEQPAGTLADLLLLDEKPTEFFNFETNATSSKSEDTTRHSSAPAGLAKPYIAMPFTTHQPEIELSSVNRSLNMMEILRRVNMQSAPDPYQTHTKQQEMLRRESEDNFNLKIGSLL